MGTRNSGTSQFGKSFLETLGPFLGKLGPFFSVQKRAWHEASRIIAQGSVLHVRYFGGPVQCNPGSVHVIGSGTLGFTESMTS